MNLLKRIVHVYRHYNDPYPVVEEYRQYLRGVPQAQPYVLSTVRDVSDDPVLLRQRLVQQYTLARRQAIEDSPVVGVRLDRE